MSAADYVAGVQTNERAEYFFPVATGDYAIVLEGKVGANTLLFAGGGGPASQGNFPSVSVSSGKWTYTETQRDEIPY